MGSLNAIIMAAGKGTRLKSQCPKVLHPLFGKPLIQRVLESLAPLKPDNTFVVVGHEKEQVTKAINGFGLSLSMTPVTQEPQLGTGHAVQQVKAAAGKKLSGTVVILSGDVPLLRTDTIETLVQQHEKTKADLTILTADLVNPFGYGRVITQKNKEGDAVQKVVEQKDATEKEKAVTIINTGVYCLNWETVGAHLDALSNDNAQGEFYLTDVVGLAVENRQAVKTVLLDDNDEIIGVNSRQDLAHCILAQNERTLDALMSNGVMILDPSNTYIAPEVSIGADSVIYPGCYLEGDITIGQHCIIGPHTTMQQKVTVGNGSTVVHSVVRDTEIGQNTHVGPFAHLRDKVTVGNEAKVGNFVEMKNTRFGNQSFASHLAYVGDAEVGEDVNIGAGTITANFNSLTNTKNKTVLEDGVKTGSNSVLVAPVTIGKRAMVAAGSVMTKDVSPWGLGISRAKQEEIVNWVKKKTEKLSKTT